MKTDHATTAADDLDVLRLIRDGWSRTLRQFDSCVDAGPLLLTFSDSTDLVWVNYGMPVEDADDAALAEAVDRVRYEGRRGQRVRTDSRRA